MNPKFSNELEQIDFVSGEKIYAEYLGGIQAGFTSPAEDYTKKKLSLDERYISNPNNTFFFKVKGYSMDPTLMMNDILIIKSDVELLNNNIAIISVNNSEYAVKRFCKETQSFKSDNPNFEPIKVQENDTVICLGVVKNLIRDI